MSRPVRISGFAVHVPDASGDDLLDSVADPAQMCPADKASTVLGRKGLLYKEPSTLLAMCAVQRALGLPTGRPTLPLPGAAGTAVVVSSNLGNMHTVGDMVGRVRAASYRDVSAMEAPNASSNVIATTIAIRFGFTGPNFMVCSGATSGLDAMRTGARLIRAGRADRVVVVGVEPADETASALVKHRAAGAFPGIEPQPLRAAAACVILTADDVDGAGPQSTVDEPGAGTLSRSVLVDAGTVTTPGQPVDPATGAGADLRLVAYGQGRADADNRTGTFDLTERIGETYGALGVLQVAIAASWLDRTHGASTAVVTCGDQVEGYASMTLRAG